MNQDTQSQEATSTTLKIDVNKLSVGDIIWVTTSEYLYKLNVCVPAFSVIMVETGDPKVDDKEHYEMESVEKGTPLCFAHPQETTNRVTKEVEHAEVSGIGANGPWSYEVF